MAELELELDSAIIRGKISEFLLIKDGCVQREKLILDLNRASFNTREN